MRERAHGLSAVDDVVCVHGRQSARSAYCITNAISGRVMHDSIADGCRSVSTEIRVVILIKFLLSR